MFSLTCFEVSIHATIGVVKMEKWAEDESSAITKAELEFEYYFEYDFDSSLTTAVVKS